MKNALTIFFGGLAFAAAVTLLARSPSHEQPGRPVPAVVQSAYAQAMDAGSRGNEPGAVRVTMFARLYGSSPRIIHVPQADDRSVASANAEVKSNDADEATAGVEDNLEPAAPVEHEPLVRRIRPAPRTALSAPAQMPSGPSPVYPTPRFNGAGHAAMPAAPADPTPTGEMPNPLPSRE
jgi:hypothetical protein